MIDSFKCDDGDTLLIPKKSFSLREDTEDVSYPLCLPVNNFH